ncbi:hypothetical protein [Mycobacterium sp.]|uniref:hypothetical protein n=1 Tax=Mycobacterium sp. TaxID=1785 RepID=UPI0031D22AEF
MQYKYENGIWNVVSEDKEIEDAEEGKISSDMIENNFNDKLKKFMENNDKKSDTSYLVRTYIPRWYDNGLKVPDNVIANIYSGILKSIDSISTNVGKEYKIDNDILYEDKNIVIDIVLQNTDFEKATYFGEYIASVIGQALNQESSLYLILPISSEFISKDEYSDIINKIDKE